MQHHIKNPSQGTRPGGRIGQAPTVSPGAAAEFNAMTVTIVLSLRTASGQKEHGFVVDAVRDVVDLTADSMRPAPDVGSTSANQFIEAIATHDEQMLILLDAESLVAAEQSL